MNTMRFMFLQVMPTPEDVKIMRVAFFREIWPCSIREG